MAEPFSAPFPDPPPYSKHFTKDNLAKLQGLREDQQSDGCNDGTHTDAQDLPDDLQYLTPPGPPSDGKYKSFGVQHDLNQPDLSLSEAGIAQLYPDSSRSLDPTPKLIALTRAILLNFLEMVGIMSNNPEESADKVEDLQTLFYNAHDLINQYRPHQARESLILMMERQLKQSRDEIAAVEESRAKMQDMLKTIKLAGDGQRALLQKKDGADTGPVNGASDDIATMKRRTQQRALWDALDTEMG